MKLRAERKALAETLSWVAQAIPRNPTMPALAGVRIAAAGSEVTLTSFDYDVSHKAHLDVDVVSPGECLAPGAFLSQIISALKGDVVELVLDGDRLTISCGRATYTTRALRLADYPTLPEQPTRVGTIDAGTLAAAVLAARAPVDDASPHPPIRGMHLDGNPEALVVVGMRGQAAIEVTNDWQCMTPFKATTSVKMLEPSVRGLQSEVVIGLQDGVLGLADETRAVTLRTYDSEFADWRSVLRLPAEDLAWSVVEGPDLVEVVKRAGALADDATPLVLTFGDGEIGVEVAAGERGGGSEYVAAENSEGLTVALDPRFLLEGLNAMPAGPIRLGFGHAGTGPLRPIIIRPVGTTGRVALVQPKRMPGGTR